VVQSPREENGFASIGMSARSGLALLIWRIAVWTSLTGSEFHCVALTPHTMRLQPGASVMSFISSAIW
jgi:hypothetical protein